MPEQQKTIEQVRATIKAARDSVWVVEDELQKLSDRGSLTEGSRGNIKRNVAHLKLVVADPQISESGEEIGDLNDAIVAGETALENNPE
jgi:hypothetical protein